NADDAAPPTSRVERTTRHRGHAPAHLAAGAEHEEVAMRRRQGLDDARRGPAQVLVEGVLGRRRGGTCEGREGLHSHAAIVLPRVTPRALQPIVRAVRMPCMADSMLTGSAQLKLAMGRAKLRDVIDADGGTTVYAAHLLPHTAPWLPGVLASGVRMLEITH